MGFPRKRAKMAVSNNYRLKRLYSPRSDRDDRENHPSELDHDNFPALGSQ